MIDDRWPGSLGNKMRDTDDRPFRPHCAECIPEDMEKLGVLRETRAGG